MNKRTIYLPEENMTVSFEVTPEKPFNKCFQCPSFRNGCSGPNILEMPFERACEFLQLARLFLNYSYQFVADKTALSLATIKRLLTGKLTDPSYYTMQRVAHFLVGDQNGKAPCSIPDVSVDPENERRLNEAMRDLERALAENKDRQELLNKIQDLHLAETQQIRTEAQAKIDFLRDQLERVQRENDHLWAENNRKSRLVDRLLDQQNHQ
jgi:transcriptional regulator with XRE-family HTH domain